MSLRIGSKDAIELFKSNDNDRWKIILKDYDLVIQSIAKTKKKTELIDLDSFWRFQLRDSVNLRNPKYINLQDLSDIMKWKLIRGKFRPLQVYQ